MNTTPHKDKPSTQGDIDNAVSAIIKGVGEMFENVATKDELKSLETKVEKRFDTIENTLEEVKYDVRDIKRRVKDLEGDAAPVTQVMDHEHRIKKLETRVFSPTS